MATNHQSSIINHQSRGGFLLVELIVSISVIGLIVVGLVVSMQGTAAFNRYQWSRQQCIAAAQAQIDSLTATGKPLSDDQIERLWPKVAVTIERSAGQGQWAGLELLEVTTAATAGPHRAQARLARYILPQVQTQAIPSINIKNQTSNIKNVESRLCRDDFLHFDSCILIFDLPSGGPSL